MIERGIEKNFYFHNAINCIKNFQENDTEAHRIFEKDDRTDTNFIAPLYRKHF